MLGVFYYSEKGQVIPWNGFIGLSHRRDWYMVSSRLSKVQMRRILLLVDGISINKIVRWEGSLQPSLGASFCGMEEIQKVFLKNTWLYVYGNLCK